ncbi:hypothetical protein ADM96_26325 [Burkholderia sp. ST111]|nr:hypothetical protein ADM96_26325 [Burkholderia sp. ST111]
MRIDAFISFGLQEKLSLQRRIGPILRGSVGDIFNLAYESRPAPVAKRDARPDISAQPDRLPLTTDRRRVGVTAMVLAVLAASDAE